MWQCTQHSSPQLRIIISYLQFRSRRANFLNPSLLRRFQFARTINNTKYELQAANFDITPMMQSGRPFPSCTAPANQGRAARWAIAGPGNELNAQSRSPPRHWIDIGRFLCTEKFVFWQSSGVQFPSGSYGCPAGFIGKITWIQDIVYVCAVFAVVQQLVLFGCLGNARE